MTGTKLAAVTGAYGYTGKYITRRLLAKGQQVLTLTGHPERPNPFGERVKAVSFNFDRPDLLEASLRGVDTLYNTYWVRFPYGEVTYDVAVKNTLILLQAARAAGVRRMVHVSITNPDPKSPLPYFRGKGVLEEAIRQSGISYALLRPTVIFGAEDILLNNIAYLLRRLPVFAVPGRGDYRLQPVFVEDMAGLAVQLGASSENTVLDAVGPETFTFDELVKLLANHIGSQARLIHLPANLALWFSQLLGLVVGDVVLTEAEVEGLMAGLLVSSDPPTGKVALSAWLAQNHEQIGRQYTSELKRHYL
jgi:NADH dehydrogenase